MAEAAAGSSDEEGPSVQRQALRRGGSNKARQRVSPSPAPSKKRQKMANGAPVGTADDAAAGAAAATAAAGEPAMLATASLDGSGDQDGKPQQQRRPRRGSPAAEVGWAGSRSCDRLQKVCGYLQRDAKARFPSCSLVRHNTGCLQASCSSSHACFALLLMMHCSPPSGLPFPSMTHR